MSLSGSGIRRILTWYAFSLACAIAIIAGVLLTAVDRGLTADEIYSAIGLNLISSVVYAIIFTLLNTWVAERVTEDSLRQNFDNMTRQITAEISQTNRLYIPMATYPALNPTSSSYGNRFNIDMSRSLDRTHTYAFRGPSARYVAARLHTSSNYPHEVKVAMLSPNDRAAIARRSADRQAWARFSGKSLAELEQEFRFELVMSIVSLFDYRGICPVDILYNEDAAVYRYEMFDDSVYISWFQGPQSQGMEMPESLRFASNSFMYQTLMLDLNRRFQISGNKIRFDASHDDSHLIAHLNAMAGDVMATTSINDIRERYQEHVAEFSNYIRSLQLRN